MSCALYERKIPHAFHDWGDDAPHATAFCPGISTLTLLADELDDWATIREREAADQPEAFDAAKRRRTQALRDAAAALRTCKTHEAHPRERPQA